MGVPQPWGGGRCPAPPQVAEGLFLWPVHPSHPAGTELSVLLNVPTGLWWGAAVPVPPWGWDGDSAGDTDGSGRRVWQVLVLQGEGPGSSEVAEGVLAHQ